MADRDFIKKKCETALPAEEKLPRVFDEQLRGTVFRQQLFVNSCAEQFSGNSCTQRQCEKSSRNSNADSWVQPFEKSWVQQAFEPCNDVS